MSKLTELFSNSEINSMRLEAFWVMQPRTIDRLPLEIYSEMMGLDFNTMCREKVSKDPTEGQEQMIEFYQYVAEIKLLKSILAITIP